MNFTLLFTIFIALLLLYDVTNKVTFDNIRAWLSEIREYAKEDVVIVLIGLFLKMNHAFV